MKEVLKLSLGGLRSHLARRIYMRSLYRWLPKSRFAQMTLLGETVKVDRNDLEQVYLEADCVREPENLFIYRALAKAGLCKTYVDVGANYGHVASKVYGFFENAVLVDANPNAAEFLNTIFSKAPQVKVVHCALVDRTGIDKVTLMVSDSSSGLAHLADSTGAFHLADERAYECSATTLESLLEKENVRSAYVKIDVEGFEPNVIRGGGKALQSPDVIVGFEALSKEIAVECCSLFDQHDFYFARFDFLEPHGALMRSPKGVLKSIFTGASIVVYKFDDIDSVPLSNFSQIVAVPKSISEKFEMALAREQAAGGGKIELH